MTMTSASSDLITRSEIWSAELKETLKDEIQMAGYVDDLGTEFPDGTQFTIPSIGDPQVDDYVEDSEITMRPLDTGEFTFTISEYLSSGTYISKKNEQDAFYTAQLVSSFVPGQNRAIMEHYETEILKAPETILGASDNAQYSVNGAYHRYSGGNSGAIELADFAYAQYALKKANVAQTNLIAIVDPSVEFVVNTLTNIVNVSNNPQWEGVIESGIATGMKFVKNIYGFDVYTSNYLPGDVDDTAMPERDGSTTNAFSSTNGVANYFFSAASDVKPWKAAWRQAPEVDATWVPNKQRTEFVTTARYGVKLFRPENMISVITTKAVS